MAAALEAGPVAAGPVAVGPVAAGPVAADPARVEVWVRLPSVVLRKYYLKSKIKKFFKESLTYHNVAFIHNFQS